VRYTPFVHLFLQRLSAFFFYVLAATFFLAFLLLRNGLGGWFPAYWLQVADLPLALSAVLFAGLSFYESMRGGKHSPILAAAIGVPLSLFFVAILVLNFWPA
jgi:hypothetical protein